MIDRSRQQGMAMILVLWLVVLLSVLATGHTRNAHSEVQLASLHIDTAKARALAEAGVHRAILDLLMPGAMRRWSSNGDSGSFELDGHRVFLAIRDARGLIDLNSASIDLLAGLLKLSDSDEETRQRIAERIADWRDPDDLKRLHGAEVDDYRAAGVPWTPRNSGFTSVHELHYVLGMTKGLYLQVSPYLTVFSNRASVDLESAPPQLVSALTGREIEELNIAAEEPVRSTARGTFHIYASVTMERRSSFALEAVVRLSNEDGRPFTVLYWHEGATALSPVRTGVRT